MGDGQHHSSMPQHPLAGAFLKIDRATAHLYELDQRVDAYLKLKPLVIQSSQKRDGDRRRITWIARPTTEPPAELGLIVGDWANNLRAALDYVVYELVRRETGERDPRWTMFPIAVTRREYLDARRRLKAAPDWSLPVFEGLQPFHDGDAARDHPLAILAEISNRDKHRLVHTAPMQIAGSQARIYGPAIRAIHGIAQNPGIVEGERTVLEADVETDGDDFQIHMGLEVAVGLDRYEIPITPLLRRITDDALTIAEWFAPALNA